MEGPIKILKINANLPESPRWDGTTWDKELGTAVTGGYKYICTPDNTIFSIQSENKVTNYAVIHQNTKLPDEQKLQVNGCSEGGGCSV